MNNRLYGFLVERPANRHWALLLVPVLVILGCIVGGTLGVASTRDAPHVMGTFHTQNLTVDETSQLGDLTHVTNLNGPTRQSLAIPGAGYPFGEINVEDLTGTGVPFPGDVFGHVIRNHVNFDTTAHTQRSGGMAVEVDGSRTAGGNDLNNIAFECSAENGQTNNCIEALKGDVTVDLGNLIVNTGYGFFSGPFLASIGPVIAYNNGLRAIYIPSDPGPTDSIYSLAADSRWNAHHPTTSSITLYNDSGPFNLIVSGPAFADIISPNGVPAVDHGTIDTGATNFVGSVTAVGANTAVVLTYAVPAFPNKSWCIITSNGAPQFFAVTRSKTAPTISCFAAATGIAANCEDFTYECIGQ